MGTKPFNAGEFSKAIALVVDNALESRGVSRNKAAEMLDASQPRINRILNGTRPMYVDELKSFSKLLNIEMVDLVATAERLLP